MIGLAAVKRSDSLLTVMKLRYTQRFDLHLLFYSFTILLNTRYIQTQRVIHTLPVHGPLALAVNSVMPTTTTRCVAAEQLVRRPDSKEGGVCENASSELMIVEHALEEVEAVDMESKRSRDPARPRSIYLRRDAAQQKHQPCCRSTSRQFATDLYFTDARDHRTSTRSKEQRNTSEILPREDHREL